MKAKVSGNSTGVNIDFSTDDEDSPSSTIFIPVSTFLQITFAGLDFTIHVLCLISAGKWNFLPDYSALDGLTVTVSDVDNGQELDVSYPDHDFSLVY